MALAFADGSWLTRRMDTRAGATRLRDALAQKLQAPDIEVRAVRTGHKVDARGTIQ
ncbi:hypothetical protein AB0O22_20980 [Streptomyces sp. NPDC091204]|uniref:hypothetical protein n=1 Tax=Streptomyces sp. NPDC091204 TaxID=3155299 RepID=UPI00342C0F22